MTRAEETDMLREFERAWAQPQYTRAVQPEIDVNRVLHERYQTSEPLTFTRTMLWDVEQRKAAAPGVYIPFVVRPGSDRAWGQRRLDGGVDRLVRCSQQRMWLRPDEYGLVLERAYLDHHQQTVTFAGETELTDDAGAISMRALSSLAFMSSTRSGAASRLRSTVGGSSISPNSRTSS